MLSQERNSAEDVSLMMEDIDVDAVAAADEAELIDHLRTCFNMFDSDGMVSCVQVTNP